MLLASGSLGRFSLARVQLGMQFIQIGSDERAKTFLRSLDNDLKEKYLIRVRMSERAAFLHFL